MSSKSGLANTTIRSGAGLRAMTPSISFNSVPGASAQVHQHAEVERVHVADHLRVPLRSQRPVVTVDVDDRILRPRHGVLRDDQRGPRLVLADADVRDWSPTRRLRPRRARRRSRRGGSSTGKVGEELQRRRKPNSVRRRPDALRRRRLGVTTIPLVPASLAGSSDRPGGCRPAKAPATCRARRRRRTGRPQRLPIWSCSVRGFACHPCCHGRGALLPHLFTLTRLRPPTLGAGFGGTPGGLPAEAPRSRAKAGGIFSVPLSFELPRPGVTRRTALRSSDFPPAFALPPDGDARLGGHERRRSRDCSVARPTRVCRLGRQLVHRSIRAYPCGSDPLELELERWDTNPSIRPSPA